MLENKEQEKIAGIISDFFDGAVNEADIDILAMKIYEKYVAKLEQDLEFTTKTANELIEIKHKLEQELAELKEKAIVPKFKVGQKVYYYHIARNKIYLGLVEDIQYFATRSGIFYRIPNLQRDYFWIREDELFATEQEAQAKLKEMKGNE